MNTVTITNGTAQYTATLDRDAGVARLLCTETSASCDDEFGVTHWPDAVSADLDEVRDAIESAFGVWIEPLPSGGGWSDVGDGEASAKVALSEEQPTHRITFVPAGGESSVTIVRLHDEGDGCRPAYTHDEWEGAYGASWGVADDGCWYCDGQVTPGGANGEVTVERL